MHYKCKTNYKWYVTLAANDWSLLIRYFFINLLGRPTSTHVDAADVQDIYMICEPRNMPIFTIMWSFKWAKHTSLLKASSHCLSSRTSKPSVFVYLLYDIRLCKSTRTTGNDQEYNTHYGIADWFKTLERSFTTFHFRGHSAIHISAVILCRSSSEINVYFNKKYKNAIHYESCWMMLSYSKKVCV